MTYLKLSSTSSAAIVSENRLNGDEVELNFKYVIQVSLCRRLAYVGHLPVKSAILARDSTIIHYARLHALLTQGSTINVHVFRDRSEAAEWLNVPIERLSQYRTKECLAQQ